MTSILDLTHSLLKTSPALPERFVKELLLELECGEILRQSSFLPAYGAYQAYVVPDSDLSERCMMAVAFFGLALSSGEISGKQFVLKSFLLRSPFSSWRGPRVTGFV